MLSPRDRLWLSLTLVLWAVSVCLMIVVKLRRW